MDSSLGPGKMPIHCAFFCKNNLYNTDNGRREKIHTSLTFYYGHSNDDCSYSIWFPVCHYISKCNQLSHCSYDDSIICFHSVKIIYQHVIAIYHQDFVFFEDSPVVAFLFLPLSFSTFSLERLSLQTAGFSVRSKHFPKHSMSLCDPVKIYSHGISIPNPPPRLTAFPHAIFFLLQCELIFAFSASHMASTN